MYKNMTELLEEKEINGWELQKFEIGKTICGQCLRVLHQVSILD